MTIYHGTHYFDIERHRSDQEMRAKILKSNGPIIDVGNMAETPKSYYSIISGLSSDCVATVSISIVSNGHGLEPGILFLANGQLLIGNDSCVLLIAIDEKKIARRVELDCVFYGFICAAASSSIFCVHELGVVAITREGDELWRYSKDVVTKYRAEHNKIVLEFIDAPTVELSLTDGRAS